MAKVKIEVQTERIQAFCRKWRVRELALFGSVLSEDFRPDSDVDVLVSLEEDAPWSAFDLVDMVDELKSIFGREVDLLEKEALRNPFRRHSILSNREVLYAA
ncbi:MAG: nucleotidyltransferase domain-containing protein [Deltaproteobacteria bacterium]